MNLHLIISNLIKDGERGNGYSGELPLLPEERRRVGNSSFVGHGRRYPT